MPYPLIRTSAFLASPDQSVLSINTTRLIDRISSPREPKKPKKPRRGAAA
jgi:hypothetical protein